MKMNIRGTFEEISKIKQIELLSIILISLSNIQINKLSKRRVKYISDLEIYKDPL